MSATAVLPQWMRPGRSTWPGLRRKKVTVRAALIAAPRICPRAAVDAGGNIHGEDRSFGALRPFVETLDHRLGGSIEIAGKTRAKQRVDGETNRFEINLLDGADTACPAAGSGRRVAPQTLARAKQTEVDRKALAREQAGGDESHRRHCCPGRKKPRSGNWEGQGGRPRLATAAPACSISEEPGVPPAMVSRSASAISELLSSANESALDMGKAMAKER